MTTVKFNHPAFKTLDSFWDSFLNEKSFQKSGLSFPAVNILESNDAYELELNAPGRNKEDFKVSLDKDLLTISFSKKEEKEEESKKQIKKEFSLESFSRSFTLDEKIDAEKIDAKYENGILTLTLPKKEEVKVMPKEIAVQ